MQIYNKYATLIKTKNNIGNFSMIRQLSLTALFFLTIGMMMVPYAFVPVAG